MKKVLISLAILQSAFVASTALAGGASGVIHFKGTIVNGSCIASGPEQSANHIELSYCLGPVPHVVLQKGDALLQPLNAGKPYNPAAPEQAFDPNGLFNISYAATQPLEGHADVNYLVSYD